MKLIFLDIDGVLNSERYLTSEPYLIEVDGRDWQQLFDSDRQLYQINPEAVKLLNKLVDTTGATVVVSSMWRLSYTVDRLNEILAERGATFKVVDKIPDYSDRTVGWGGFVPRWMEIKSYLDQVVEPIDAYVILDDIADMGKLQDQLVVTDYYEDGLDQAAVDRAIEILGR